MQLTSIRIRGKTKRRTDAAKAGGSSNDVDSSTTHQPRKRQRESDVGHPVFPNGNGSSFSKSQPKRARLGRQKRSRFSFLERLPAELLSSIFQQCSTVYRCDHKTESTTTSSPPDETSEESTPTETAEGETAETEESGTSDDSSDPPVDDHPDLVLPFSRLPRLSSILGVKLSNPSVMQDFATRLFSAHHVLRSHPCLHIRYPFLSFVISYEIFKFLSLPRFFPSTLEGFFRQSPPGVKALEMIRKANDSKGVMGYTSQHCPFCGQRKPADAPADPDESHGPVVRWCGSCGRLRKELSQFLSFPRKTMLPLRRLLGKGFDAYGLKLLLFIVSDFDPDKPTIPPPQGPEAENDPDESLSEFLHPPFLDRDAIWAILSSVSAGDDQITLLLSRFFHPTLAQHQTMVDHAVTSGQIALAAQLLNYYACYTKVNESADGT